MNLNRPHIFKSIILIASTMVFSTIAAAEDSTALFDGSNLEHWNKTGDANWEIVDKVVQASSGNGMLVSKQLYSDFHLTLDFWVDKPANSGIFIRCSDPKNITASNSYEVNIFDTRPDQTYRTGGIVNIAAPKEHIDSDNQWNHYEITAKGKRLTVKLNGKLTVDTEDEKYSEGVIGLQYGAGIVKFRDVKISTNIN